MSAGIQRRDRGIVLGQTWHRLPQYQVVDQPIPMERARGILDFDIEKEQVFRPTGQKVEGNYSLVRKDFDEVIYPSVGERYTVIQNDQLLKFVDNVLKDCDNLSIESVGTLFNGQTSFCSLKIAEYQVKGDKSPTVSRLMWSNPSGGKSLECAGSDVRIQCANTLRVALMQGGANETVKRFRHTAGAVKKVEEHFVDMAVIYAGLDKHKDLMNFLAEQVVNEKVIQDYLARLMPVPALEQKEDGSDKVNRSRTMVLNKHKSIRDTFDSDDELGDSKFTLYGLLQATTNYLDHHSTVRGGDEAYRLWSGLSGGNDKIKQGALGVLQSMATA